MARRQNSNKNILMSSIQILSCTSAAHRTRRIETGKDYEQCNKKRKRQKRNMLTLDSALIKKITELEIGVARCEILDEPLKIKTTAKAINTEL